MSFSGLWFLWACAALWLALLTRSYREMRRMPHLPLNDAPLPDSPTAPLVSVLLPARNEADRLLADCVHSLFRQTYPRLEIIAVDDRSTDDTAALLQALAQTPEAAGRMTIVSGAELPEGWVGKQHALMQAAARARGEWIVTVDADALYEPSVIARAVARAQSLNVDALSLLPRFEAGDFLVSVVYPVGAWALLLTAPPARVNRPDTATALAWGGFFLLRRSVFQALGGYAEVRSETSEDTKMAALLKRRGFRLRVEFATDLLFTPMYPSFADLWRGTMKNVYAGPLATPLIAVFLLAAGVTPALTALAGVITGDGRLALPGALCWASHSLALIPIYRMNRIGAWRALFAPLGVAVAAAQMLFVTWRIAVTGQGISWRGRPLRKRPSGRTAAGAAAVTAQQQQPPQRR